MQEINALLGEHPDIGQVVHLGPLGTALLPYKRPRVLLIDELGKSDTDLSNELLNVFKGDGSSDPPSKDAEIAGRFRALIMPMVPLRFVVRLRQHLAHERTGKQ